MSNSLPFMEPINSKDTLDIQILYSPPGEMSETGCWNAFVQIRGIVFMYSGNTPQDVIKNISLNLDNDMKTGSGLVG